MLEELKKRVFYENLAIKKNSLSILTWGNVSGIDRESGLVVIKPSGVDYDRMKADDMVVVDLDGNTVEGDKRPSSDTPTHLYIYKTFKNVGGIVHTHSTYATSFAQSGKEIIAYGTTHADTFSGNIPVTRALTKEEIEGEYEKNTGKVIAERFSEIDYEKIPAVLVKNHGPFTWGRTPEEALENSVILEEVAKMAFLTLMINKDQKPVKKYLLDKHYERKHGKNAYYGQK